MQSGFRTGVHIITSKYGTGYVYNYYNETGNPTSLQLNENIVKYAIADVAKKIISGEINPDDIEIDDNSYL